jgi:hypothetical protein
LDEEMVDFEAFIDYMFGVKPSPSPAPTPPAEITPRASPRSESSKIVPPASFVLSSQSLQSTWATSEATEVRQADYPEHAAAAAMFQDAAVQLDPMPEPPPRQSSASQTDLVVVKSLGEQTDLVGPPPAAASVAVQAGDGTVAHGNEIRWIGPEGGFFSSLDKSALVSVFPGVIDRQFPFCALRVDCSDLLVRLLQDDDLDLCSEVYELKPEGVQFIEPIAVCLKICQPVLDAALVRQYFSSRPPAQTANRGGVQMLRKKSFGERWEPVECYVRTDGFACANVDAFGWVLLAYEQEVDLDAHFTRALH